MKKERIARLKRNQKYVDQFRKLLSKKGQGDKDMRELLKHAINHPAQVHELEDFICFDAERCLTACDGRCCTNTSIIRINPADVDAMMQSPFVKDFLQLDRKTFVMHFLDVFLGRRSELPMATIKMKTFPDGRRACPFMVVFISLEDEDFRQKVNGICALGQANKPNICKYFPFGRIHVGQKKNDEDRFKDEKDLFIRIPTTCPATKTSKKIQLREYLSDYKERNELFQRYVYLMMELKDKIQERTKEILPMTLPDIMKRLAHIFFLEEKPLSAKLEELERRSFPNHPQFSGVLKILCGD